MTVRTSMSEAVCPVARSLDVLGDPWTLLVLREVFSGNRRFDGIKAGLGITDTVLSNRLQRLVDEGLLDRSPYGGTVRPRVEYVLTEAGEDTLPVLHALARWGRRHTTSPVRGGGILLVESADWCTTCVAALNRDRTGWRRASEPEKLIALATA